MEESQAPLGRDRLRLIEEIGDTLGGTEQPDEVLQALVRPLVPSLADLAVLVVDGQDAVERLEVAHVDSAAEPGARQAVSGALGALRRLAAEDLRRNRMFRWIPVVNSHTLTFSARSDPSLPRVLHELQVQSLIVVALRTGARIIGALGLARITSDQPYKVTDLATAQVVARRVAVAVETARLEATMRDAESRHTRLEEALLKWTRVFDLAGWGVAIVDGIDRRIDVVNPAFARMHGYREADELTGRLFSDLIPADRLVETASWGPGPDRKDVTYESLHLRADGRAFPVLVNVTAMDDLKLRSYVVTVQDVSELKRAEERLLRAQRMEAVGRLAGGVAHEVSNMMTIVLGFSDLLGRADELPEHLQHDVEEIRKAATRAGRITQQLLAFSRQQLLQTADLRLNSVVEELVPMLRLLLPANIKVETGLSQLDGLVRADRAQLEQVLINLAFNARDAMARGGTIRLATEMRHLDEEAGRRLIGIPFPAGQYALISVVDTGIGMDQETLDQIFEPFFTTKPVGLGTGLGLATVYGIVKQSGGYVWAESNLGEGTTFTVGLPIVPAETAAESAEPGAPPAEPAPGGTVLVIEDETGVRKLASRILESRGYLVLEARNGLEALTTMDGQGTTVDLVLTDVVVPDMETGELERRMRQLRPDLPILYMSGYGRDDVVERSLIHPEQPFLQKPFTAEELVEWVGRALRERDEVVGR